MKHNQSKLTKITSELSLFLFSVGATEISTHVSVTQKEAVIVLESNFDPDFEHKFAAMKRLLSSPRDEALENEYWSLAGSTESGEASQLLLVGVMTDSAEVIINQARIKISLRRKLT